MRHAIYLTAAAAAALVLAAHALASQGQREWRAETYARHLAARQGWVGYQWSDLKAIVGPESGWDPCSVNPSRTICDYQPCKGCSSNSCGVPQATPCPAAWLGRLDRTWRAQVRWLIRYVLDRYGTPSEALAFHLAHGWY